MKLINNGHEVIKFCPWCKDAAVGMEAVLEKFGRNKSRADGLHIYCRECRSKRRVAGLKG